MPYRVGLINPLPRALSYYQEALARHLRRIECEPITQSDVAVEGLSSPRKILSASSALLKRANWHSTVDNIIVLWPAFGYLDALTWMPRALATPVTLILHDVDPLRRQFGYGRFAKLTFSAAMKANNLAVITHTHEAAERLRQLTGVLSDVVPHPVRSDVSRSSGLRNHRKRLLVLGQYKEARSLGPLTQLGREASQIFDLRVVGRGWPPVEGWNVRSEFVSEDEFTRELDQADVVLLPYRFYQQSGVMVRAFELGIPVVGAPHPQLAQLYGRDWPGTVREDGWRAAVDRVLDLETGRVIGERRSALILEIEAAWAEHLGGGR